VPLCTINSYVDAATGNDAFGGTSFADAKKTIQAAVDQVSPSGTVQVAAGSYAEAVSITKNGVTLQGAGAGPNLIANNTLTDNGRFGIEIKLPNGTGAESSDDSIVVSGNTATTYTDPTTITLGANPGGGSLSGTITVNAVMAWRPSRICRSIHPAPATRCWPRRLG
jgi:pectin methylesterase-like acyl-CoA thioesterase